MGNAGESLRFGLDQDEECERDIGEDLSQIEMPSIHIAGEEKDVGITSRGGPPSEHVSATHLGCGSPTVFISRVQH